MGEPVTEPVYFYCQVCRMQTDTAHDHNGEPPSVMEARRVVDAHECRTRGHDWDLTLAFGSVYPVNIFCRRACGLPPAKITPPQKGLPDG